MNEDNIFRSVCPQDESLNDVISCLAAWFLVPSRGVALSGPMFLPLGVYVGGVSVRGNGFCSGGFVQQNFSNLDCIKNILCNA